MKENKKLLAKDLKLGDVVRLHDYNSAFSDCTVINIENGAITLFRPYVHLADFTYTGGVIPYVGFEKFVVLLNSPSEYVLIDNIYREKKV